MKKVLFFTVIGALVIWSFVSHLALPLAIALVAATVWAVRSDNQMWKTKPVSELIALVEGSDSNYWQTALEELQRRGEDISPYAPLLLRRLLVDSKFQRVAADTALKKLYPELKDHLRGFFPTDDVAKIRERLAPLLAKYGI